MLGFRVWYDEGILEGRAWRKSIEEHIQGCRLFMIFVSNNALLSDNVLGELDIARKIEKVILSVFLANDISTTNLDYNALRRVQGIDRWDYGNLNEYYPVLIQKLQEIVSDTREDPFDRESRILGLGYLPTLKDVLCDHKTSLTPEEQEERRNRIVFEMHNCTPPIKSYHIDNVFQITSEATNALHNLKELKLFKTYPEKPSNLLSLPLDIKEVYVAPLRLVTGLITRLDQNWPPLVASYSSLVKQDQVNRLADLHYYIEFCWLAWGPSVLTTSLFDEKREFMVVQAAFGDEANSIPLIMKAAKWKLTTDKLGEGRYSGWPVCLKNVLVVRPGADEFFKAVRSYPLFGDVFSGAGEVALYLPHEDNSYADGEIEPLTGAREAYYSTAYVWLMLEQIAQDEVKSQSPRHDKMKPGNIIPFFEHANLATTKGLDFLQHCLARKAIYHVLDCENDPDYSDGGYYRFATALFPGQMVEILKQEIIRLTKKDQDTLEKRFKISENPKDWRTPFEVVKFADAVEKAIEGCCKVLIENSGACDSCKVCSIGQ